MLNRVLALIVLSFVSLACSAVEASPVATASGTEAGSTPAATEEPLDDLGAAGNEAAARILELRQTECIESAHVLLRAPSAEELAAIAARVPTSGFHVDGDKFAPSQYFVGSWDEAVAAYGGEGIPSGDAGWIVTEEGGEPIAIELRAFELADGRTAFTIGDRAKACT